MSHFLPDLGRGKPGQMSQMSQMSHEDRKGLGGSKKYFRAFYSRDGTPRPPPARQGPAERTKQTARRRAIYEELHPETKAHVAGAHGSNRAQGNASAKNAPAFTANTAAVSGKSERGVQRDAERGEKSVCRQMERQIVYHVPRFDIQ